MHPPNLVHCVTHSTNPNQGRAPVGQEVKELVRGTRDALGTGFLGSLESFLVYLQTLMHFCERFARDARATAAMLVRLPGPVGLDEHCQGHAAPLPLLPTPSCLPGYGGSGARLHMAGPEQADPRAKATEGISRGQGCM